MTPSGPGRPVYVYQVDLGSGEQDLVSVLEPGAALQYGLCTEAILGIRDPGADDAIPPELFRPNRAFVAHLAVLLGAHLHESSALVAQARAQGEGEIAVVDGRCRAGAPVAPPDLLGTVLVHGGELVRGSYQHNPEHRLLTGDGFFVLPPELELVLHDDLEARCCAADTLRSIDD